MVTNDNIERLKKAIGIDFSHSHAPIDQPQAQPATPQTMPSTPTNSVQTQTMPPVQPKSVIPKTNPIPKPVMPTPPATNYNNIQHTHIQTQQNPTIPHPQAQPPINNSQPKPPITTQTKPEPTKMPAQQPKLETPQDAKKSALFVKIDRHVEITDEILNTRIEMRNMLETISLLNKAEKLKSDAVNKIEKRLNVFDEKLNMIDNNLVAPKEFSSPSVMPIKAKDVELGNMQSEIDKLKAELNTL